MAETQVAEGGIQGERAVARKEAKAKNKTGKGDSRICLNCDMAGHTATLCPEGSNRRRKQSVKKDITLMKKTSSGRWQTRQTKVEESRTCLRSKTEAFSRNRRHHPSQTDLRGVFSLPRATPHAIRQGLRMTTPTKLVLTEDWDATTVTG